MQPQCVTTLAVQAEGCPGVTGLPSVGAQLSPVGRGHWDPASPVVSKGCWPPCLPVPTGLVDGLAATPCRAQRSCSGQL